LMVIGRFGQPSYPIRPRGYLPFCCLRDAASLILPFPPRTLIAARGNGVGLCGDATRQGIPGPGRVNGPHGPGRYAAGTVSSLPPFICPAMPFLALSSGAKREGPPSSIHTASGRFLGKAENGSDGMAGLRIVQCVALSIEPWGCGRCPRVTQTFCLGCTARQSGHRIGYLGDFTECGCRGPSKLKKAFLTDAELAIVQ